ncbi:MAG: hypothetical protein K4H23_00080 [Mollicutes bacterium PWAP]|nr:hypothetical protein [Mollicutes bacterium PWAP]
MSKNENDIKLSKYFKSSIENNKLIEIMKQVSLETGISNVTISRYCRRKGFDNFGNLISSINKSMQANFNKTKEYLNLINQSKDENIIIVTSKSCSPTACFLKELLKINRYKVILVSKLNDIKKYNYKTFFISRTMESLTVEKYISINGIQEKDFLLTTDATNIGVVKKFKEAKIIKMP